MEGSVYELIYTIVDSGLGSKVLHKAKVMGIAGGTIFLGKGTASDRLLDLLGISDVRKEIVLMVADTATAERVVEALAIAFGFHKPKHGIAFTTPVYDIVGSRVSLRKTDGGSKGVQEVMHYMATVIVDKGKAEQVVDAAVKAGSKGGTIINARGSGIHETSKVFSMEIEPEKEVVLIVAHRDKIEGIVRSIRQDLKIDEPGNGIIFIQPVNKAYGLQA